MQRALNALRDGRSCHPDDRPKHVTIRTMLGLKRRGLIERKGDRWELTALGLQHAE